MKRKKSLSRKKTTSFYCFKNKQACNNDVDKDIALNCEQISIDFERELKELEDMMKELEQIKKEYYSKNIQLEKIQKQTAFEIIKSVIQRNLKTLKNNKNI